jgi:hypothetical protein
MMLIMKSTYAENNVSTLNVIFTVAYDTLAALFVVNRGVHNFWRERMVALRGRWGRKRGRELLKRRSEWWSKSDQKIRAQHGMRPSLN